ncbi:MAG: 2-oxo acid dehydrogenase subunit E2 [Deltaproteobacteria bacterium]|nr:MAG: 2-oxo acid dehydrogenase subunit E2 [Deltaproteobacteria bacterium]
MYEFKLPDLGEGIHEGELVKWYVQEGDIVQEDDPLVDVETDKAAVTIPSPVSGRVLRFGGEVGDTVIVGDVIAVIEEEIKEVPVAPVEAEEAPPAPVAPEAVAPSRDAPTPRRGPVPAAPATRRLARELGVELRLVTPSGPSGRIMPEDVKRFAEQGDVPEPPKPDVVSEPTRPGVEEQITQERRAEAEFAAHACTAVPFLDLAPLPDFERWGPVDKQPLRSIRRKVAHKMVTSMTLVPHVAHMDEADVTLLEEFRRREKERRMGQPGGHLTLLAFVIKAVTAGLRATPPFNASLDPFTEEIVYKKYYNIGIAVDTEKGLVVPVVRETDRKSIMEISAAIEDLAGRAREGKLQVDELQGGTFTITNVGPLGGTALIPAINYPEVAILGMGRVQEKPVVRNGHIVIRQVLPLTLSFDHRVADGADAARFVSEMVRELSDPNLLLLET